MVEKIHIDFRDQIAKNKRNSVFLMISVIGVIVLLGYVISLGFGEGYFFIIMSIAIVVSLLYTWFSFYNSDKIAIAAVRAKKASRQDYPDYYRSVEGLTIASGLPMPRLYVMQSEQMNAFASGRNPDNAVLCFTTGALEKLNKDELDGVVAHELSHVANYDIRFITLVTVMVGMVAIFSEIFLRSLWFSSGNRDSKGSWIFIVLGIVLAILAPIVVWLIQMAVSRKREFVADASAVKFTRNPQGLIKALKKIKYDHVVEKKVTKAEAQMFFANPFKMDVKNLASTHPPLEKRIEVLEKM